MPDPKDKKHDDERDDKPNRLEPREGEQPENPPPPPPPAEDDGGPIGVQPHPKGTGG